MFIDERGAHAPALFNALVVKFKHSNLSYNLHI